MDHRDGLMSLGLKPLEAAVLQEVLASGELTNVALCTATGGSPQSVGAAVASLVKLGLVEQVISRRPHIVFLHARADEALDHMVAQRQKTEEARRRQVEDVAVALGAGVERRLQRGRPYAERRDTSPSRRGRTSHDAVIEVRRLLSREAPRSTPCAARLLVTDAPAELDLSPLAAWQQPGSEVRRATRALPLLAILDGERVMVFAGTAHGQAAVWSWDARHVAAAQELFELWWAQADPGVITPTPPVQPEPEWDVEEWDPADL